uniref:Uncharacterized protein n=1 Tax=Rhizophora mucronata TaxID=61149 RepID=A0A2P2PFC2_RHIMU
MTAYAYDTFCVLKFVEGIGRYFCREWSP